MPERTNIVYLYDGTPAGLLCCIFDSYVRKEMPAEILPDDQYTLFPTWSVQTEESHAQRVYDSLLRISPEIQRWVQMAFFSCIDHTEMTIFQFIRLAYQYGARLTSMLTNHVVCEMFKLVRMVGNEKERMIQFLRFSDYNGVLVAVIEPKCITLPMMREHFCDRFCEERFLIFDKAHGIALYYQPYEAKLILLEQLSLKAIDDTERSFREFWTTYYETIAIEGRINPRCRMNHMPKRFWKHMTELVPLTPDHAHTITARKTTFLPGDRVQGVLSPASAALTEGV